MDDDPGVADDDERTIELSTISAIYPELVIESETPYAATLDVAVTPISNIKIRSVVPQLPTPPTSTEQDNVPVPKSQALTSDTTADDHDLAHLPPLTVHITLPEHYPVEVPPSVRLTSTPPWVPKKTLKSLEDDCRKLWEDLGRAEVVYTYIDHLAQAAESAFGIGADDNIFQVSSDMKLVLLDFNAKAKRDIFDKETFSCGVCLEPKKGSNCHQMMLCGHVFCVGCLQDFYEHAINEGDVEAIKCLDPGCKDGKTTPGTPKRKKQDRTLNPSELLQIPIEQQLVQRYVRLKRKRKLEADKNTIYCPRQWCQGAARSAKHPKPMDPLIDSGNSDSNSGPDAATEPSNQAKKPQSDYVPMSERLSICEDCSFAFCSVCKRSWHGEMAYCNPRRENELNEEEKASKAYVDRYSTACPTCSVPSQKSMGCNHMICTRCSTHFCYLCSSYLMSDNPYSHYNDLKGTCYMRLWELEGGDGEGLGRGYDFGDPEGEADANTDSDTDDEVENVVAFVAEEPARIPDPIVDDSDEERAAPDQRRPGRGGAFHIEIVNAAGQHIIHNIPERPRPVLPAAPAPQPAARRNRRRRGQQQAPNHRAPPNHGRPPPALQNNRPAVRDNPGNLMGPARLEPAFFEGLLGNDGQEDADDQLMVRAAAAPGQGNAAAEQPVRAMGLERFLELANNDQEDEWDSDELDDDLEAAPRARVRRDGRRY